MDEKDTRNRTPTKVSSFSTGGGGEDFQSNVTASYLASLLVQGFARGLGPHVVTEVRLQQSYKSAKVDDLVVIAGSALNRRSIHIQAKHQLPIGQNQDFVELLERCWHDFNTPRFQKGIDRLALAVSIGSLDTQKHYRRVIELARATNSYGDLLEQITAGEAIEKKQFLDLVVSNVCKIAESISRTPVPESDLLNFLQSFTLLDFDFHGEEARDYTQSIETLRYVAPPEQPEYAHQLFVQLYEYAGGGHPVAAVFDSESLTLRMRSSAISIGPTYVGRCNLDVLKTRSDECVNAIKDSIGSIVLRREKLLGEIVDVVKFSGFVELVGSYGSGKSAMLKAIAGQLPPPFMPLAFSSDRIEGNSWSSYANAIGVPGSAKQLALSLGSQMHPCLLIDGVDRIDSPSQQNVITDLLAGFSSALPRSEGQHTWTCIVTRRADSPKETFDWLYQAMGYQPHNQKVDDISTQEFDFLAERIPFFKQLPVTEPPQPLLRNLKFLALLANPQITASLPVGTKPISEADLTSVWWDRVVDPGGVAGIARKKALLSIADTILKQNRRSFGNADVDATPLYTLTIDGILRREVRTDRYYLDHDIIEEWVLFHYLKDSSQPVLELLEQVINPYPMIRPLQLLVQFNLEAGNLSHFSQLLNDLNTKSDQAKWIRWRQALLLSPLYSAKAEQLLDSMTELLLRNDATCLRDLLTIVKTVEVDPEPAFTNLLGNFEAGNNIITSITGRNLPRGKTWLPLIAWIVKHAEEISFSSRNDVAQFILHWQQKSPRESMFRSEIGKIAVAWLGLADNC